MFASHSSRVRFRPATWHAASTQCSGVEIPDSDAGTSEATAEGKGRPGLVEGHVAVGVVWDADRSAQARSVATSYRVTVGPRLSRRSSSRRRCRALPGHSRDCRQRCEPVSGSRVRTTGAGPARKVEEPRARSPVPAGRAMVERRTARSEAARRTRVTAGGDLSSLRATEREAPLIAAQAAKAAWRIGGRWCRWTARLFTPSANVGGRLGGPSPIAPIGSTCSSCGQDLPRACGARSRIAHCEEPDAVLVVAAVFAARPPSRVAARPNGPGARPKTCADIDALGLERSHRNLTVMRKGGAASAPDASSDDRSAPHGPRRSPLRTMAPTTRSRARSASRP